MNDTPEKPRLMIAPRHPERFDTVCEIVGKFRTDPECEWREYTFARRPDFETQRGRVADIILLDSVGELRQAYPLADIVFVGGSLIPHGGQSVIEPAISERAIITGPYTENFNPAVKQLQENDAIRQLPIVPQDFQNPERLYEEFVELLGSPERRRELGQNAAAVMEANRGATEKTVGELRRASPE